MKNRHNLKLLQVKIRIFFFLQEDMYKVGVKQRQTSTVVEYRVTVAVPNIHVHNKLNLF